MTVQLSPLPQGDDRTIRLTAVDQSGTPIDLTDAVLRLVVTDRSDVVLTALSTDPSPPVRLGATPADGEYVVELADTLTSEWPATPLTLEVKARLSGGTALTLLRDARLQVQPSAIKDQV